MPIRYYFGVRHGSSPLWLGGERVTVLSTPPIPTSAPGRRFGAVLRRFRESAGLSQHALAERAYMSERAIRYLENGTSRPYPDTLRRLADALALTAEQRAMLVEMIPSARASAPEPGEQPGAQLRALPIPPTPLIGRAHAVAAVTALLHAPAVRLVTLTGPGGTGKTRLALAVAATLGDAFSSEIAFVPLAALTDPELVLPAIAAALRVKVGAGESPMEAVRAAVRDRRLLLVLDNCEQIAAAGSEIADLLAACPQLAVLATSRAVLHLRGELVFAVPPLALPDLDRVPPPPLDLLADCDAIRLFVARAREIHSDFRLTIANAEAVAGICQRLDGLPLAIELAAARTRALTPQALLERLGKRLDVLTGGARDLPERQRTLRAAIDWSHSLLARDEQILFRRLAVFAGGCTLDEAAAICDPSAEDAHVSARLSRMTGDLLDGIEALVGQSLVRRIDGADGEPRYGMLETIREYASERLAESGEATAMRERFVLHYLALSESAAMHLRGPEQVGWLTLLEREHDNLRSALGSALDAGMTERAMRIASALAWFWRTHGHYREGRHWVAATLAQGEGVATPIRARALDASVTLALFHGDYPAARHAAAQGLAIYAELGDQQGIAKLLGNLGVIASHQGEYRAARRYYEQALALHRDLGNQRGIAGCLTNLGLEALYEGEYDMAWQLLQQSLAISRALDERLSIAMCLNNLGLVMLTQGDVVASQRFFEQSLAIHRELGHQRGIANLLNNLGRAAFDQGNYAAARPYHAQSLAIRRKLGDMSEIAESIDAWAALATKDGDVVRAARLFGFASGLRQRQGSPGPPPYRRLLEGQIAEAKMQLASSPWAEAWESGRAMREEEAITFALEG